MKSTCPHCGTTYRIDPRKVPVGGVHARCSKCNGVFEVASPAAAPGAVGASPDRTSPTVATAERSPAPPSVGPGGSAPARSGGTDSEGQVELPQLSAPPRAPVPAPSQVRPAEGPPASPVSAPEAPRPRSAPAAPTPPPLFGRPDPHGKARRLARALVSDIAVYNPERRDRGLAEGTLRQEFREEIRKSWDEYVAQVGESIARGTPYFREALNEILAGGRAVF